MVGAEQTRRARDRSSGQNALRHIFNIRVGPLPIVAIAMPNGIFESLAVHRAKRSLDDVRLRQEAQIFGMAAKAGADAGHAAGYGLNEG
jgi:hypothetical protein